MGKINCNEFKNRFDFIVPVNQKDIIVEISPDDNTITAYCEVEVSENILHLLKIEDNMHLESLKEISNFLEDSLHLNIEATKKTLSFIKYFFQQIDITEGLIGNCKNYCSKDNINWLYLPSELFITIDSQTSIPLNSNTVEIIQRYIDENYIPFFALTHLHRAMAESNPRYKWIDATIAAELAIKEFLCRKEPVLEELILKVPSPSLDVLYGPILSAYAGEVSPSKSKIKKGVEKRNKLLHQPNHVEISTKEANQYVHDVQAAVYHLLTLLYPHDSNLKRLANTDIVN